MPPPTASCSLAESIKNADKALAYCLCNKFFEAEKFLDPLDENCMYHTISKATISYLQALLTYEQEYISKAYEKVKVASHLCERYRKKQTWSETLHNFVGRPFFNDFTEMELHAELCYAECMLERAMLTFIQDENLISFIKGGLKIRSAYNMYRNCMNALEQKPKQLAESNNKIDFESGVYMGMGSFNVLLSLLPARVLRLLEWVGFSGNKENGLKWLDDGFHLNGLRSSMCAITLLGYQIVISPLLGIGDTNIPYSQSVLNVYVEKFPESAIFLYFSGRLKQTQGFLDEALELYVQSVSLNIDWQQMHHICYWEMMWCYSFQSNWQKAAEYAEKLSTESRWSKSSYLYMQAAFLLMQQFEMKHSGDEEQMKQAEDTTERIELILDDVGKYKQRVAGKSIPFEKFAVRRVEKYRQAKTLVIPGLELIHVWNGFSMFKEHKKTLEHFLHLSEVSLREVELEKGITKERNDDACLCKLVKGICLRYLQRTTEAEKILNEVAASSLSSHSSKMDSYFPPFASCELGFMYRSIGEHEKAFHQLQHTLKHYSKYGLESRLHFRIHSGIESLKSPPKTEAKGKRESDSEDEFFDVLHDTKLSVETSLNNRDNLSQHSDVLVGDDTEPETDTAVMNTSPSTTVQAVPSCNSPEQTLEVNGDIERKISTNSSSKKSPKSWFRKKTKEQSETDPGDASPYHTPCSSPALSEASSTISPVHTKYSSQWNELRVTAL